MTGPLGELTVQQFLDEYWQKKPCLIRGALPGFIPPLDADDLAGLACEEMAESRLVSGSYTERKWTLEHGPFEEEIFSQLAPNNWTLLVQDVEKHYSPLQELLDQFNFIPSWRLDDVMVSYAVTGGSVGPHVDQYDVFLYQGQGRRLWQIATQFSDVLLEDCPLNVLNEFEPEQEWILNPGDMLYLPPNVAHHGIALEECMTWSIGLRAPSAEDLLVSLGEALANQPGGGARYTDPHLQAVHKPGEIDSLAVDGMQKLLLDSINDPATFTEFLGAFITRFRLAQEPVSPDPDLNATGLLKKLQSGSTLSRNPWTKLAWVETQDGALLFATGVSLPCSAKTAIEICANPEPDLIFTALTESDLSAVVSLVNGGHLVLSNL
jgi:50S ribosomal protein L16 3-hydroxylase